MKYDVIVVGGGISGTIAAIASARCGANTLLVEKYGFLGGTLTASGVGPMMTFHAGEIQVVQGITDELIQRLKAKGQSPGHIYDTNMYAYTVTPFDAEGMKHELELMLLESGGKVLYHTMLAGVKTENGRIRNITVCNKQGLSELEARVYVDATGDADLSAWAGVECIKGRPEDGACQPMTLKIKMYNVDISQTKKYIRENPQEFSSLNGDTSRLDDAPCLSIGGFYSLIEKARKNGEITFEREAFLFFETNNPGEVIVNTTRIIRHDPVDMWSLSDAETEGRRQAAEVINFAKKYIPGFQNAVVMFTGPAIGIRSSRQIVGLHVLTADEIINCAKFEDVIAHGGYPIDIHPPEGNDKLVDQSKVIPFEKRHLKNGEIYSIPYRSLINNHVMNLITVGRSISATFEAQGAIRVSPIAGAIGHGGGVAAALAVKTADANVHEVDIKQLQHKLREQNAFLMI